MTPRDRADGRWIAALALAARLVVVAWGARFPPAADGTYYQRIAERIARGLGYTWLWADGAVTYASHYPIGYPAALGALYALTGPRPVVAMGLNAALGALAAWAVHRLAAQAGGRRAALVAGALVALHPGLLAYTPALMTEGVTAALITLAAAAGLEAPRRRGAVVGVGLLIGAATLVRPQSIVLAPAFAWLAAGEGWRRRLGAAGLALAVALCVCAPWTARNCVQMKRCALVSVNGGWNLLIGADEASTGAWSPVKVPEACREVYDEAAKDACFGREAQRYIAAHPAAWLALVPRKLGATFDYAGAAGWYLHESNPGAFGDRAKIALGAVETLFERVVLLLALYAITRAPAAPASASAAASAPVPAPASAPASLPVLVVAALGAVAALTLHAWLGYVAFAVAGLLRGRSFFRGPLLPGAAVVAVVATLGIHAAFFGAGRYSLVVFPLVTGVAALAFRRPEPPRL